MKLFRRNFYGKIVNNLFKRLNYGIYFYSNGTSKHLIKTYNNLGIHKGPDIGETAYCIIGVKSPVSMDNIPDEISKTIKR